MNFFLPRNPYLFPAALYPAAQSKYREMYKNDKKKPLNLRVKGTRAYRRRLSKDDAAKVTVKQAKKNAYFPIRQYALKA